MVLHSGGVIPSISVTFPDQAFGIHIFNLHCPALHFVPIFGRSPARIAAVFCDHLFEIDLWSHLHDPAHAGKATFGNGLGLNIGATYKMVQKA